MSLTVEKCLQAWTNSLRQMNAKADIAFFGDSLTYYGDFSSVFPDKVVCNLGLRGDTIQGMIERVELVKMLDPQKLFLMAGTNDVATSSLGEFKKWYESLIKVLIDNIPNAELVVFNMLPVDDVDFTISCNNEQIMKCNEAISSLCIAYGLRYVDIFNVYARYGKLPKEMTKDGIHLIQREYVKWYSVLQRLIG